MICDENIIKEIWHKALSPGYNDLDFSRELYRELAEYVDKPLDEIEELGKNSQRLLNDEWEAAFSDNPEEYYRRNTTYLYNLIHWHANYGEVKARVQIMLYLMQRDLTKVLDFGAGVGSTAILFAVNGFDVSVADIAEHLLSFLQFRMKRRGLQCDCYNLNDCKLPLRHVDAVTAIDVLEHVENPKSVIKEIYQSLKPGGLFCFNVCGNDAAPMHISEAEDVLCYMNILGFARVKGHGVPLFIYKKVSGNVLMTVRGIASFAYYRARLKLRHSLSHLGVYENLKQIVRGR